MNNQIEFSRKVERCFCEWQESLKLKKQALLVKGLRQIGKTTIIKKFAREHYKHVVCIDFIKNPEYKEVFAPNSDIDRIIMELKLKDGSFTFVPGETVIIFDEIQECSSARRSIKSFMEDGRFDLMCSGSLLGINGYNLSSDDIPVGYEYTVKMYPMDFEEFLWALNVDKNVIDLLENAYSNFAALSEAVLNTVNDYFLKYICVGGMPFIVKTFLLTNDLNIVRREQLNILESFKADFGKHLNKKEEQVVNKQFLAKINKVYDSVPSQLAKENKKFTFSKIEHGASLSRYDSAIQWLEDYGLIKRCYNLSSISSPLSAYKDNDIFKIYFVDTGLFVALLDDGSADKIIHGDLGIYKGAIFENIVADAFVKSNMPLYYFHKESGLEIDFIANIKSHIFLIEVKAKNGNTKSAKTVLQNKNYEAEKCIKLGLFNVSRNEQFINYPHFLAYLIK